MLKYAVLIRAYELCSKRRSSVQLEKYFNKEISLKRILFMMDRVSDRKPFINDGDQGEQIAV